MIIRNKNNGYSRRPVKLKLGRFYALYYDYRMTTVCKFIKPTRNGYNFLRLVNNDCYLKQHLYKSSFHLHKDNDYFFVNANLTIVDVTEICKDYKENEVHILHKILSDVKNMKFP